MKKRNKFFALLLAAVMVLSVATVVFADNYRITVSSEGSGFAYQDYYDPRDSVLILIAEELDDSFSKWIITGDHEIVDGTYSSKTLVLSIHSDINAVAIFGEIEDPGESANGSTAGVVIADEDVYLRLSISSDSSSTFDTSAHSYTAIRLFDLYKVVEADGTTQATDANGNNVYQYRCVSEMTEAMKIELANDIAALGTGWAFDPNTCAITINGADVVSMAGQNENTSNAAKLASCLAAFADKYKNVLPKTTLTLDTAAPLQEGYYVIYENSNSANDGSVATKPILIPLNGEEDGWQVDVALKDESVNVDKKTVTTGAHSPNGDDYSVGDVINFEIDSNFPVYQATLPATFTPSFVVSDTLSAGLTLDQTPANIIVLVHGDVVKPDNADEKEEEDPLVTNYTVTTTANSLVIAFDADFIKNHQGESIVITYNAVLNENAVYNDATGNTNTATISYGNNPMSASDVKTVTDESKSYTYAFDLRKLDGASRELLANAVFELKKGNTVIAFSMGTNGEYIVDPEGTVTEITTTATGDITIIGVDEGTYILHEKSSPSGYSVLAQDVTIVVTGVTDNGELTGACQITVTNGTVITDAANDTEEASKNSGNSGSSDVNVVVRNFRGVNLPTTGSISAIIIGISGLIAVIGGGAFIAKKKND